MLDILVYLFENYYTPQACPEANILAHKLAAVGFEDDDINDALGWLHRLGQTAEQCKPLSALEPSDSHRIYANHEYQLLGTQAIGFIQFLESSGSLPPTLREIMIEQALATDENPVSLQTIKVIALMVLWSQQAEIDHLVFEELMTDDRVRPSH